MVCLSAHLEEAAAQTHERHLTEAIPKSKLYTLHFGVAIKTSSLASNFLKGFIAAGLSDASSVPFSSITTKLRSRVGAVAVSSRLMPVPSIERNAKTHFRQLCGWRRTIIHMHGHNPVSDTWKQWFVFQLTKKRLRLRHTSAVPEKTANVGVGICRIQLHKQSHNLDATELLGSLCLRLLVYDK